MLLFINETGHSMHFLIFHKDPVKRDKMKELVERHLGCVSTDMGDLGPHTVVLMDCKSWSHQQVETFRLEYIRDCIQSNRVLDISRYLLSTSKIYKPKFPYMDVVYYQKYEWQNVPINFTIQAYDLEHESTDYRDSSTDENDDFFAYSDHEQQQTKKKNTRRPYSKNEKEAIIQYIVSRKLYNRLKGNTIWKELEKSDICPIRSWQSLKEHTLKHMSKEINTFNTISKEEKKKLDLVLNPKKKSHR